MRTLITGGAGFIGSHLAERLLAEGNAVAIIDDLNDYYDPRLKRENLAAAESAGAVDFVEAGIGDEAAVETLFARFKPEVIVHLAARAGVRPSLAQPLLYEQVNCGGTVVLLEACRRHRVKKFVFASSSSIYGAANRVPFSEEDHTNLPISPYAATKIAGEKLCYTWSHLYGLDCVCLRFFTVYGPRQRPDLAIRKFIELIEAGRAVPVFGDGSMGRDYTFVADTVQGICAAIQHQTRYDIFNLGNSSPVGLLEMVRAIESATGRSAQIDWQPEQPGDVPITYADISKARRLLGYNPQTPFIEGLRRQVEWLRSRR